MSQLAATDRAKWPRQISVLILLYCVFVTAISDNFLGSAIAQGGGGTFVWLSATAFLTIIFSPIQSGYSDYYCRRNSLVLALIATLIYVALANYARGSHWSFLLIAIVFRTTLGNALPIAWAGIADLTHGHQFRFVLSLSVYALGVGMVSGLSVDGLVNIHTLFYPIAAGIVLALVLFSFGLFKDREDLPREVAVSRKSFPARIVTELSELIGIYKTKLSFLGLAAFVFSELSFYQIIFRIEVLMGSGCLHWVPHAIGIGYTLGAVSLKFVRGTDGRTGLTGLLLATLSITLVPILIGFGLLNPVVFLAVFSLFSFGFAWFTPSLFSLITPKGQPHIHGKIFGIVESTDGISILITYLILWVTIRVDCLMIFSISAVLLYVSLIFMIIALRHSRKSNGESTFARGS